MKIFILSLIIMITFNVTCNAQIVVIANKSVPVSAIDVSKLISIYNLNTKAWDNGTKIMPANLKSSDNKKLFFDFVKISEAELKKVWLKKKLTDGADIPKQIDSDEEMINFVKSTPGAIGFVSKSKVTDDVKILLTIN